ncbi:MAG: helix-turn-helix transcriptional regulator [Rubrivivax sp.]|nr:helix-turn-helix transcriptional regulator [Rubrivivax sp.]
MPAKAPPIGEILAARLVAIGSRLRAHRKQHKVTATSAAEAAGISRVTLHRIERGEPSVTMGAYLSAIAALGLELEVADPPTGRAVERQPGLPASIRLDDYAQLKRLAWQLHGVAEVTPAQALNLYERNWRHIDEAGMEPSERALVRALAATLGGGRLLV